MTGPKGPGAFSLTLPQALLWTAGYLGVLLFCIFLDVAVWRKLFPNRAHIAGLVTVALASLGWGLWSGYRPRLLEGVSGKNILLALACAALFFLVLDKGLDPLLDRWFPQSSQSYSESLEGLRSHPATALLRVCLVAPVAEEFLTRGMLLGGLESGYGWPAALAVSAGVFALLHFNLVQTLSALVCGLVLGALYLHTGSLLCCILAHAVYNFISYMALLRP